MAPSRTHTATVCCTICNQAFNRQEHLTRHLRIHTREKPFQCSLCEKRFSRLDVLNRHITSHEESCSLPAAGISSRACRQCATDRVRCSRGEPCKRCAERMLPCLYPTTTPRERNRIRELLDAQQDQQTCATLEQAGLPQLSPNPLDVRSTHAAGHSVDAASSAFTGIPAVENSTSEPDPPLAWIGPMGAIDGLYDINQSAQSGMGVSGVNWMSPEYELAVDWDVLLSGYAPHNAMQPELSDGIEGRGFSRPSTYQLPPQPLHAETQSAAMPAGSVVESTISSNSSEGRYYVDGTGARAPFGGRAHTRDSIGAIATLNGADVAQTDARRPTTLPPRDTLCSPTAYESLVQVIQAEYGQQLNVNFDQMQAYVHHYFDSFHPVFPFLRKRSFENDTLKEPMLLLAVTVVGSRYSRRVQGSEPSSTMFRVLQSMLRRRRYGYEFGSEDESDTTTPHERMDTYRHPNLETLQAGVLNVLCMVHSGKKTLVDRAQVERHYLVEACNSLGLLSDNPSEEDTPQNYSQEHASNQKWLRCEARARTGFMIWLLDSILLYEFDTKPLIQTDDIKANLPSHEDVWESPCLVEQGKKQFSGITLLAAMEMVYMEKRLPSHLGEFSIGLLINAIYRHTVQVIAKEQLPLNSWVPTAVAQNRTERSVTQQGATTNPSLVSRWRNSACDCLDVLHWPANSKVAQLSGSEHHTILHLHLARLIILTPTTQIQVLATGANGSSSSSLQDSSKYAAARQTVLQWVLRDRYKARLSIVHCGALFWHVRRYSCDSVLEPYAIYMATLVLWAFCVSVELSEGVEASAREAEEEPEPSFLHLDRPLDDELVQTYVRLGHKMSAFISGVGNIQSRGAPPKIIREGISLLSRDAHSKPEEHGVLLSRETPCYTWGIEKSFVESLRALLHLTTGTPTADQT